MESHMLEIPAEVFQALRLPAGRARDELQKEFAVFLVKEGLLPRSQARVLAGVERLEFEALLAQRKVPWEGTVEEVLHEVDIAKSLLQKREVL